MTGFITNSYYLTSTEHSWLLGNPFSHLFLTLYYIPYSSCPRHFPFSNFQTNPLPQLPALSRQTILRSKPSSNHPLIHSFNFLALYLNTSPYLHLSLALPSIVTYPHLTSLSRERNLSLLLLGLTSPSVFLNPCCFSWPCSINYPPTLASLILPSPLTPCCLPTHV